ncbi:hypothetical protein TWF730_005640 [Orbilia blumenaviensis]|uniref:F-box domain-containing protein n=1 Tax=Orbilia blumenaviensis TaxID=1796055 RepID=A0AAV9VL80_9PEZI
MSATKSAFETYELLELILSFIPCSELLIVGRRVSKRWRTIIDTSLLLKWATWRHPGTEDPFFTKPNRTDDDLLRLHPQYARGCPADLVGIQEEIDRNHEINPVAPIILRKYWETLVTTLLRQGEQDVPEEVMNSVSENFIKSIEPLGLYLTRPAFQSTYVKFNFVGTCDQYGQPNGDTRVPLQLEKTKRIMEDNRTLADIIQVIYTEVLSSQGWNIMTLTGRQRLKSLRGPQQYIDVSKDPMLHMEISNVQGKELNKKAPAYLWHWMARLGFGCSEPWTVDIMERPASAPHKPRWGIYM